MAHQPWHQPRWGLGGRADAEQFRSQGLLGGSFTLPDDLQVVETEEEKRLRELREEQERDQRNALASGFGRASEMLLAPREWQPMANLGLSPGYAALGGRSGRFA